MTESDNATPAKARATEVELLEGWANVEGVRFVSRSHGQYTTQTVSRDSLFDLMRAVQAAERERCAEIADDAWVRDPHIPASDAIRRA